MRAMPADATETAQAKDRLEEIAADLRRRPLPGGGTAMLAIFLLSGASGLIYQVVWSRALTLVFGSTTQGVATVLAAFMGGLALGSWLASRIGDRIAAPLRAYGLMEGGIALLALCVLLLMPALETVYRALYPLLQLSLAGLTLVRFLLAAAFLLPTTTLMGATLPILSAYFERRGSIEGQGASILYAVNTAGAVAGTAAAGFWLLPLLGMRMTTLLAASLNLIASLGALYLSRRVEEGGREILIPFADRLARDEGGAETARDPLPPQARAAAAAAIAVSGTGALILEVSWTRTLSMILGSSTHAFTVMLTVFLIGLAAGSAVASRLLKRIRDPVGAFARVELATGVAVYAGVYIFPELPYLFLKLFRAAGDAPAWFGAGRFALAGSVMLVPTFLLGAAFPLAVRCQRLGAEEAARPVGFLYAVNTLGAIIGSLAAGFLLVPSLGLRHTVIVGALVNLSVGAFLLAVSPSGRRVLRYALAGFLVLLMPGLLLGAPPWNPLVMTSGVFQYAPTYVDLFPTRKEFLDYQAAHQQLFYRDGLTTTVTVEKRPMRHDGRVWLVLTVNGKVDASSVGDMETQILLGQLPMLMAPDPRRVMVIGWGSGITVGSILTHGGAESVRALEIEPAVVEASRFFQDHNNRPLDDPRASIEINDARHALLVDPGAYDVIVSEPSNPWLSGPSRLFTREFFLILRERLAPGGILCQWVQLYGLEVESYRTLLRTLDEVFDEVLVFKGSPGDTLVVAGTTPLRLDVSRIAERMQGPAVKADLLRAKVNSPASLFARFRVGGPAVGALVGPGPLNTDDNSLIEFAAARTLHVTSDFDNDRMLTRAPSSVLDHLDAAGLPPAEAARLPLALARELIAAELPERASNALSRTAPSERLTPELEAEVEAIRGELHAGGGDPGAALASWERALEIDPSNLAALLGIGEHLRTVAGDARAALAPLRRAVEAHPDAADARLALGRALRETGRAREAVEILEAAARGNPPARIAPFLHMEWGRACHASGDSECAIRELTRYFRGWRGVVRPAEVSLDAALDLGGAYMAEGRLHEALEHLQVAAELGGSLASWNRDRAREALQRGDAESAESHLRRAIEWHATDAQSYHILGDLLMTQGRWEEAHAHWTALLERHPDDRLGLRGAVDSLSRLGRLGEAVPLIRRLIDLEEDPRELAKLREVLERAVRAE